MSEVHLTINGQAVTAPSGATILQAAQLAGIDIPTLCNHPAVSPHGACRMCLVSVKGMRGLQTACTCPVSEGMEVETDTEAINAGRRFVLQLLFSERNHYCMFCQVSGDCELQELAYRHGLDHWTFPRSYRRLPMDASARYITMDPNRCVLCTRCVRACAEIAANHTLGLRERGARSMIMADVNVPLGASSCVECGTCVQVCPTGALMNTFAPYAGHEEDLDHTQTTCMQCSVGCTIEVVSRANHLVRVDGVWDAGPSQGLLCVDGRYRPLYDERERVTQPLVRRNGELAAVPWDEALRLIAGKLKSGSALGLAACATSNEALAAFAGLFAKAGGQAGRLEPAAPILGYGPAATLADVLSADFVLVAGVDPLAQQRVVGYFIKRALDSGAQLAVVDGGPNELREFAHLAADAGGAAQIVAEAGKAARPVVVYGAGVSAALAEVLRPLHGHARFLRLDQARNGGGAAAAGLAPLAPRPAELVVFLLGEAEADGGLAERLDGAFTVVQAAYRSPLTERADVVLPTPIWAERSGHFTNLEGRALPLRAALTMPEGVRDEAEVLQTLAGML